VKLVSTAPRKNAYLPERLVVVFRLLEYSWIVVPCTVAKSAVSYCRRSTTPASIIFCGSSTLALMPAGSA